MNNLIIFLKGVVIGIGKIIPGVSGAVIALILGVYDQGLNAITNLSNKKNILFLFKIGLGILCGIILFSNIIKYLLNNYYPYTMLFFIGLIIGGTTEVIEKVEKKDYKYSIITCIILCIISLSNINNTYTLKNNFIDYLIFFIGGIIESAGTIIPGLSSTALLLIIGIYNNIINSISNLLQLNINYKIIIPFSLGILSSIFIITKAINYLFNKHEKKTYSIILGLTISSIITLIVQLFTIKINLIELLISLILMTIGIFITNTLK